MHVRRLICLWFVALGPVFAAAPAAPDPREDAIRELVRTWLRDTGGVGISIGVADGTQRRFFNAGATRLDGNKPPTKDTIYEIGSIGKALTGQLLARAVVEGRAQPDDEVAKYLVEPYPNLENGGEKIRLRHLADTTSGLVDLIPDVSQVRTLPNEPLVVTRLRILNQYTRPVFLQELHRLVPRKPPGTEPGPSNVGGMLLGIALEKIYGEPFPVTLAREIEKPLRMGHGTQPDVKLLARGYSREGDELPPYYAPVAWPSTSLRYSAEDLLEFAAWQAAERDASVKLAHKPTWTTPSGKQSMAYYWVVSETTLGRRLTATGGTSGFSSFCDLYPGSKLAIVVLANKSDGAQGTLRALSAKIAETLRPDAATSADAAGPPATPAAAPTAAAPPPGR